MSIFHAASHAARSSCAVTDVRTCVARRVLATARLSKKFTAQRIPLPSRASSKGSFRWEQRKA